MSRAILASCFCLFTPVLSYAQPAADAPSHSIQFGFDQRVRNENWNNILDYGDRTDDEREQIRYRTRVWVKAPLSDNIDVFVGLNQETNQWLNPSRANHFDEVILENAYVDFKKLLVNGLSLRVGRQNLNRGEGFVMIEGTPGDGSRSIYFNAADLAYSWKKSKVELIGILNPRRDRMLPRINDQQKALQNTDDSALGIYYTDNNHKKVGYEAYYFYKKETNDCLAPTNPQFQPDRHIHTAGARAVRRLPRGWSLTGEFAGQWGAQHPAVAIRGWGGYGYAKKQFTGSWKPYVLGGWWGFSGDDPATKDRVEGWDPLFSRWPKYSELYIYSQVRENGVGYWTNTGMWQGETGFSPHKRLAARLTYYHMNAFHAFPRTPSIFGTGTGRGENVQARLDFTPNQHWSSHVLYETQVPGDFYSARSRGYFLRFEISYSITGRIGMDEFKHALGLGGSEHASHASTRPL